MGMTYYMRNLATKEYTESLGKIGEFNEDVICLLLNWDINDVEIMPDHDKQMVYGIDKRTGKVNESKKWKLVDLSNKEVKMNPTKTDNEIYVVFC